MRTVEAEVWEQFAAVLAAIGIEATFDLGAKDDGWDAAGSIEGVNVVLEVKSTPTVGDVLHMAQRDGDGSYKVLVSRSISGPVADAADTHDIGRFDSRGHLRLWHRPLMVDADVAAQPLDPGGTRRWRIDSPSALDVALAVLNGMVSAGVRATAAEIGRSPGTVSKQLAALRKRYLVDDDNGPVVPGLFDAVLGVWMRTRVPLARLPELRSGSDRLGINLDNPESSGWVLADATAAAAWGAPVLLPANAPPDLYVPDASALHRARATLGTAGFGAHACTVAVAPCPYVCRRRYDRSTTTGLAFFAPSPVVAALDLASDPARGREVLEQWSHDLPPELPRVW